MLGISDSNCPLCCTTEPLLNKIHKDFKQDLFLFKQKQIEIARVDISQKYAFIEKEQITSEAAPTIAVFYDGRYYIYDGSKDSKEELIHFINRVINPIVQLKTDEDVENFLDVNKEWQEKTKFFD